MDSKITIVWHGHSCFSGIRRRIHAGTGSLRQQFERIRSVQLSCNEVLCSHGHHDHAWLPAVTLHNTAARSPFQIRSVHTWHDDSQGSKRGENLIHVIHVFGKTLVHCGDLGHLLTKEQIGQIGSCDVLMVPVGGFYTIDAAQARQVADQLSAAVIIPMHYRFGDYGIPVIGEVEDFLSLAGSYPVHRYPGNRFTLESDISKQIAVLTYQKLS